MWGSCSALGVMRNRGSVCGVSVCVHVCVRVCPCVCPCVSWKSSSFPQPGAGRTEAKPRGSSSSSIHLNALHHRPRLPCASSLAPWGSPRAQTRGKGSVPPKRLRKRSPTAMAASANNPTLLLQHIQPRRGAGAEPPPASPPCSAHRSLWSQPGGSGSEAGAQRPCPACPSPAVTALSLQAPRSPVSLTKVHRDLVCKRDSRPRRCSRYRALGPQRGTHMGQKQEQDAGTLQLTVKD